MECDKCGSPAVWIVFAAYDIHVGDVRFHVHPQLCRYPNPMIRSCDEHVIEAVKDDEEFPASTKQWVVKRLKEVSDGVCEPGMPGSG